MTDSLSKSVGQSIGAHALLAVLLVAKAYMAPDQPLEMHEAIRVDIVGLPEKNQSIPEAAPAPKPPPAAAAEPPPNPAAKPQPQPKVKAPEAPKVVLNSKKAAKPDSAKTEKHALDAIKQMAALDKIQDEVSNQKVKAIKGNRVSPGSSLTGLEKIDYDRYFHEIETRLRQNWSLPQWLADSGLRAQALVLIDESGQIKKKKIITSSGNQEFDDRMMDAIDKAAPFPAPPDRLKDVLSIQGIIFNFPQRGTS